MISSPTSTGWVRSTCRSSKRRTCPLWPSQGIRRHRRVGQHQHRPAVQAVALGVVGAALDGRHRPGQRGPGAGPQARPGDQRRGRGLAARPRREAGSAVRGHQRLRAPRRRAAVRRGRHPGDRPDARSRRARGDSAGEPARASRCAERQHDHLRRAGDHPDRVRGVARRRGALCRDRRVGCIGVGGAGDAGQHRRVHQDHQQGSGDDRRRQARQGDHHPQPRRSADDHARHHLLRHPRGRRPRRDRPVDPRRGRRGADLRAGLPAAQRAAVRRSVDQLRAARRW